jgi:ABC-type uncharacterized transport system YnjBCD permease subunit
VLALLTCLILSFSVTHCAFFCLTSIWSSASRMATALAASTSMTPLTSSQTWDEFLSWDEFLPALDLRDHDAQAGGGT